MNTDSFDQKDLPIIKAIIWAIALVLSVTSISFFVNQDADRDNAAILEAVKSGIDPIKARCAIKGITSQSSLCILSTLGVKVTTPINLESPK